MSKSGTSYDIGEALHEAEHFLGKTFEEFNERVVGLLPNRVDKATVEKLLAHAWDAGRLTAHYEDPEHAFMLQEIGYLSGLHDRTDDQEARVHALIKEFTFRWGDPGFEPVPRRATKTRSLPLP
jgi:hypothetical protein